MKIAMIQHWVGEDVEDNFERATAHIRKAQAADVAVIILPEMFVCPYTHDAFKQYAQTIEGKWVTELKALSELNSAVIVAGSMPIRSVQGITNTAFVFQQGQMIARHDKIHLFDIDIPDQVTFFESETLIGGQNLTTFRVEDHLIGLAICYDVRFPEIFALMADQGIEWAIIPAAFNMTTGPAHWSLLARARAVDYQCFITMVSPARNSAAPYVAYGHSLTVDPWGTVLEEADEKESIKYLNLDFEAVKRVRKNMPLASHRRFK